MLALVYLIIKRENLDNIEQERLSRSNNNKNWKKWGPYLSDRQWGTVREDYSPNGNAWNYVNHDLARSYAYRWGEEGIGGFCDSDQILCLAPAFWNGKDSILKRKAFWIDQWRRQSWRRCERALFSS